MGDRLKKHLVITIGIPWRIPGSEFFLILGNETSMKKAAFHSSAFILPFLSTGHGIYVCNICTYCLGLKVLGKTSTIICHSLLEIAVIYGRQLYKFVADLFLKYIFNTDIVQILSDINNSSFIL